MHTSLSWSLYLKKKVWENNPMCEYVSDGFWLKYPINQTTYSKHTSVPFVVQEQPQWLAQITSNCTEKSYHSSVLLLSLSLAHSTKPSLTDISQLFVFFPKEYFIRITEALIIVMWKTSQLSSNLAQIKHKI